MNIKRLCKKRVPTHSEASKILKQLERNPELLKEEVKTMKKKVTSNKFAEARMVMSRHLSKDEGLYITYKSNIAMYIYDHSKLGRQECNDLADELISLIWSIPPLSRNEKTKRNACANYYFKGGL